jgi:hypothetical protein
MTCYRASVNQAYNGRGVLQSVYPPPPSYSEGCPSNIQYKTLPPGFPMRETLLGPNSLKHLYRGPWYYPPQKMLIPNDSMYGYDSSELGPYRTRVGYGTKLYPYQHRHPREISEFASEGTFVPLPNQFEWTKYPVIQS